MNPFQVDSKAVNGWHRHMAAFIVERERLLGAKHLVAAGKAIHDDPNVSLRNWHYVANMAGLHEEHAP